MEKLLSGSFASSSDHIEPPGTMKLDLAQYREVAAFAKFGSDLDPATQQQLNRGVRLYELLKQPQYKPLEAEEMIIILFAGVRGYLDRVAVTAVGAYEKAWLAHVKSSHPDIMAEIISAQEISKDLEAKMRKVCDEFTTTFSA